jgi:hypothetical protein
MDRALTRSHPNKAVDIVAHQTFYIAVGFRVIIEETVPVELSDALLTARKTPNATSHFGKSPISPAEIEPSTDPGGRSNLRRRKRGA